MATINTWDNNVLAANVTFNGGTMNIGSDSTDNEIQIGTAANAGRTIIIGNATGSSSLAINCGTGGITIGTTANSHASTFGSTNSTSSTTIQSGTGGITLNSNGGGLSISGFTASTGTINIATDSTTSSLNIGTGAGAKTVQFGSSSDTANSAIALQYGTGGFTMASASGNVMQATSAGYIIYYLNSAVGAYQANNVTNVTGDGAVYTVGNTAYTVEFDRNSNFNTDGTFTAPVTGVYHFGICSELSNCTAAQTVALILVTSARNYVAYKGRAAASTAFPTGGLTTLANMTAADTAYMTITATGESSNKNTLNTSLGVTSFTVHLAC
jgi:hypothetical protein